MPPPLQRQAISAFAGSISSRATPALPRTGRRLIELAFHPKPFSTNMSRGDQARLPPESPRSVVVPEPPQSSEQRLPLVRGHLPVPREIFSKKDRPKGAEHVRRIMPFSVAEQQGLGPRSDADARRRRMTELRRRNLTAGLQGLYARRREADERRTRQSRARYEANLAAAQAPEGRDDALTRSTVLLATRKTAVETDPRRFKLARKSRARTEALARAGSQARRDALAQLYMAASNFIVDEAELERRVDQLFTGDHHSKSGYSTGGAGNNWDAWGAPATVAELRAMMMGTTTGVYESNRQPASRTTMRQKVVSEELTGGKLD